MDVETAETLMSIGKTMAITGFGSILYFLSRRPVEDDASERMDPMEPPVTNPIEDAKWLAEIDEISPGDEAATAEPSETNEERVEAVLRELQKEGVIKDCFRAPLEKEPTETFMPKNPRWERPEIKVRNDRWYSVFSPPMARGEDDLVGCGVVVSRGSGRVTIRLEDGTETRRRVHNLVPTRASWGPR